MKCVYNELTLTHNQIFEKKKKKKKEKKRKEKPNQVPGCQQGLI